MKRARATRFSSSRKLVAPREIALQVFRRHQVEHRRQNVEYQYADERPSQSLTDVESHHVMQEIRRAADEERTQSHPDQIQNEEQDRGGERTHTKSHQTLRHRERWTEVIRPKESRYCQDRDRDHRVRPYVR